MIDKTDASSLLDKDIASIDFGDAKIIIVSGHGRSDIGKAELVSRIGVLIDEKFSIIKYDGFLNTNVDGRYPSRTEHDFVVYRKFHEHIGFGGANLILNGEFIKEFLKKYGESKEHLSFSPHVAKYFVWKIFQNWVELLKPKYLILEIGGTFADLPVISYVLPAIRLLQQLFKNASMFLLTETNHNGTHIKSKPVINALNLGLKYGVIFDKIFVRMPKEFSSDEKLKSSNRYIEQKISDSLVYSGRAQTVISIPHYFPPNLIGYTEWLLEQKDEIFSGVS